MKIITILIILLILYILLKSASKIISYEEKEVREIFCHVNTKCNNKCCYGCPSYKECDWVCGENVNSCINNQIIKE